MVSRVEINAFRSVLSLVSLLCVLDWASADPPHVFSLELLFCHLHEEVVIDVVVTVYSWLVVDSVVFLKYLASVLRTVHLHLCHVLGETLLILP